jgi:hypothetical protein
MERVFGPFLMVQALIWHSMVCLMENRTNFVISMDGKYQRRNMTG